MIRPATVADYPKLLQLGRAMHAESRYARYSLDEAKLLHLFQTARDRGPAGFLRLYEDSTGDVVGGMLAFAWEMWFGRDLQASEMALFVPNDKRGGIAAARLIHSYVEWAKGLGCKEIAIGSTTGVNTGSAVRLYESAGFQYVGPLYRMEV